MATHLRAPASSPHDPGLRHRHAIVIGVGIFVTTLAQTAVIGDLPLRFLLKNRLHVQPETMALFMQLAVLPWELKLLAGLLSDSLPLCGYRRRSYLLLSGVGSALFWGLMALLMARFWSLLACAVAMNAFLMLGSTVSGAVLVEEGQKHAATGRLSALRQVVMMAAVVVAGPLSGYLATRAFGLTAAAGAALAFLLAPCALFLLRETPSPRKRDPWRRTWQELKELLRARSLLIAAGLLFLVQVAPGFVGSPIFYYQTNVLHFTPEFLGELLLVGGITGIGGALIYAPLCRRMSLRWLLVWSMLVAAGGTLIYLGYRSRPAALAITAVSGLVGSFAQLPLFDLAARATPPGSEALGYAIMMAVWNLGMSASDLLGSWLFQHFHLTFMNLVWLNAGTTAATLFAIPFLPRSLVLAREGQVRTTRDTITYTA